MGPRAVDVNILGQTYRVKGEADDAYVKDVARYVDGKMKELNGGGAGGGAGRGAGGGTIRVAVLAAFNIADELFQLRKAAEEKDRWSERNAAISAAFSSLQ